MNLSDPLQPSGPMPVIAGQTLQPGDRLEHYEIVQVLGPTSFGVLYLARHEVDGSTVAIKEYLPSSIAARTPDGHVVPTDPAHISAYDRGLQAFVTEALTLSQFDHPNLLRVTAIWESGGTAYRSMPYLSGNTLLARRAGSQEPASQAQLQQLLDGLLGALLTLSQAGLAHGQIEPVNIYLLEDGQPVLMDFDAVHHAVLSDLRKPHVDAYADPSRTEAMMTADLHAVAAVLHFAVSNEWSPPNARPPRRFLPLSDVLLRFKDSASALGYQPEFLAAVDAALALPPDQRPGTVTEMRALFEPKTSTGPVTPPAADAATATPDEASPVAPASATRRNARPKREPVAPAPPSPPLGSSASVLALLANFDRGPAIAAEHVEPFQVPEVPTLTEEAEPALPPLKENPFDDIDAGVDLPSHGVGYTPIGYTPMPRVPRNPWRKRLTVAGIAAVAAACLGLLGWQLFLA